MNETMHDKIQRQIATERNEKAALALTVQIVYELVDACYRCRQERPERIDMDMLEFMIEALQEVAPRVVPS